MKENSMDEARKARLHGGGINVDNALERFMGNEAMLERYLNKFLNEKSYAQLVEAISGDDREGAGVAVHTLKSVCGTLGCEAMHRLVVRQEQHIRAGEWDDAVKMMPTVTEAYKNICAVLQE